MKEEQSMYCFISKKNSEYIYKKLKEHDETNDVCKSLKKFKNTNKIYKFYKKTTEINKIQSFEYNEKRWKDITRTIRTCQKHNIKSQYIDIGNEETIILYDSKSVVNYTSTTYKLCLRAFNKTNIIK